VLEQLGDPATVLHIGLPARDLGKLRGVGQDAGDGLLEPVEDRWPVHARALHRHVGDGVSGAPIAQA